MLKLKTGYAYLFFFLYSSVNSVKNNILVQWKAILMVILLECCLITAFLMYIVVFFKIDIPSGEPNIFVRLFFILPLVALKFWFFERNDNWRTYIAEFEKWPEPKRKKWNWIMRGICFFIIGNLLFSFYWMSEIDWTQYR